MWLSTATESVHVAYTVADVAEMIQVAIRRAINFFLFIIHPPYFIRANASSALAKPSDCTDSSYTLTSNSSRISLYLSTTLSELILTPVNNGVVDSPFLRICL